MRARVFDMSCSPRPRSTGTCRVSDLHTEPGIVKHTDGRSIGYGDLAPIAATLPLPTEQPPLKDPKQYRILGTRTRVVDTEDIVTGRARYGLDATLPGALTAVITRCPTFDGELKSFDATAAKKIPGVRDVIALPGPKHGEPITANLAPGVAVIADNTWAALQGQRALKIEWTPGPFATESSATLDAQCAQLFKGNGARARNDGDFDAARAAAAQVVEATYRVPFVSHAPLEPQNACVDVRKDSVLIVAPLQMPSGASRIAAQLTGIDRLKIEVRMTRVGGGFGRRLTNDFIAEAVMLSKQLGKPIKLLWTREEDMRHDFFRPFGQHHLIATLDTDRQITGWAHRLASASKYYRRPDVKPEDLWTSELYPDDFPAQLLSNVRMEWFGGQLRHHSWLVARARAHCERVRRAEFCRRGRTRHAAGPARSSTSPARRGARAAVRTTRRTDVQSRPTRRRTASRRPTHRLGTQQSRRLAGSASQVISPSAVMPRTRWK